MALLTLSGIGKIYAEDGNVAVGIRGVDLSFEKGEFACITGKSGSGKSTLLNVISGMDSYEEGELYIEGEPTSHYVPKDWEEYRNKYISFIFQDYNIIDSFTVLENVELALMHIDDPAKRRKRALDLIERVGLSSHLSHKGSKLSGGQKQRTVIARALAKDSPIILADEPTGNLDSRSSREIIDLLYEISHNKLVIVVTHNFDDFAEKATRHVRIYDGAVESDTVIREPEVCAEEETSADTTADVTPGVAKLIRKKEIRDGARLGLSMFIRKPKLSVFICLLLIVGTVGIFLVTSLTSSLGDLSSERYMFEHIDGRLIITKRSGEIITDAELSKLATEVGAESYLHYDILLDKSYSTGASIITEDSEYHYLQLKCEKNKTASGKMLGRYPEAENEVFLSLPISFMPMCGEDELSDVELEYGFMKLKIVGVEYFYDNNLDSTVSFTDGGFRTATAIHYILTNANTNINVDVINKDKGTRESFYFYGCTPSFDVERGKIYISDTSYRAAATESSETSVSLVSHYYNFNYYYDEQGNEKVFAKTYDNSYVTDKVPNIDGIESEDYAYYYYSPVMVHPSLLVELAEEVLERSYMQASLFFEDDKAAHDAALLLKSKNYVAVPSDTTYSPDGEEIIFDVVSAVMEIFIWLIVIVFIAFFINLCSSRAIGALSHDMAIMRSMGIPMLVIRIGMYVRILISLIPAVISVIILAILIYTSPLFNMIFTYLYAYQYAMIFLGMILLSVYVTRGQIKKLFNKSVKSSLRGGEA